MEECSSSMEECSRQHEVGGSMAAAGQAAHYYREKSINRVGLRWETRAGRGGVAVESWARGGDTAAAACARAIEAVLAGGGSGEAIGLARRGGSRGWCTLKVGARCYVCMRVQSKLGLTDKVKAGTTHHERLG